ncbi:retrovirus-related Pol polyprotein from transposon opus [Trichonephila clavipes]|nr:retrovirus-related Pol polyprotein from transposon opus [Trichonephila clavipes]
MDYNLTYYDTHTTRLCIYLNGHPHRWALDWFEVLGYRVVEDKAPDYAHLKQALSEQFPVVRNRSELETRFYSSSQKQNQKPCDFVYDLLKIHKILKLEMTEEKLIDHIISGLEPQILEYVDVSNLQTTSNLLQIIDKYEEQFLNRKIREAPVLQLPNFTEQFKLFTDASGVGIGAVLNQNHRPIAFGSRTLNKTERNYTVTERECLAVIWALNKFKTYFGSLPVKVITDHAALTKLTNGKNLSCRMIRWALKLSEINIEWEHRTGGPKRCCGRFV